MGFIQKEKQNANLNAIGIKSPTKKLRGPLLLTSVLNFAEPSDNDVGELRQALKSVLEDAGVGLLSFETALVLKAYQALKSQNIFGATNCVLILQALYVRTWETRNQSIINAALDLVKTIAGVCKNRRYDWSDNEGTAALFCVIRLWLLDEQGGAWVKESFGMLTFAQTFSNMLKLVGLPGANDCEKKILNLINQLLLVSFIGDLTLSKEQLEKMKICAVREPDLIKRIVLQLENSKSAELVRSVFPKDSGSGVISNENDNIFNQIVLLSDAKEFEQGLAALEKLTALIFQSVSHMHNSTFIEHFVIALDLLSKNKELPRVVSAPRLASILETLIKALIESDDNKSLNKRFEEIAKSINMVILKLIEHAHPNRAYESLFFLIDAWNKREKDLGGEKLASKFLGITVRCIIKLT